jgi:hypothetical protein
MTDATGTVIATSPPAVKPGYKSTEWYLSLAAVLLGALTTSGLLADGTTAARIAGLAVTLLAALGYTWSRTQVKAGAP